MIITCTSKTVKNISIIFVLFEKFKTEPYHINIKSKKKLKLKLKRGVVTSYNIHSVLGQYYLISRT
jgi:hypothetical protein